MTPDVIEICVIDAGPCGVNSVADAVAVAQASLAAAEPLPGPWPVRVMNVDSGTQPTARTDGPKPEPETVLEKLRAKLDGIDERLLDTLRERFGCCSKSLSTRRKMRYR